MAPRNLQKRACQKCEYINPREALYCLRCGEIFRPVLASTPWEFLRPEREVRRAEALGKAALRGLGGEWTEPPWTRLWATALALFVLYTVLFSWSAERVLRRTLATEPSTVTRAIWVVQGAEVDRALRPGRKQRAAGATFSDPLVLAWMTVVWPLCTYLLGLGFLGFLRREVRPARFLTGFDVLYPLGAHWADLIAGRRRPRPADARIAGAPAVLVAAGYWAWGILTMGVVPAGVYAAELRVEGWRTGLASLGLELPERSRIARQGLWADADGTLRLLVESGLEPQAFLGHYIQALRASDAKLRLERSSVFAVRSKGERFTAVVQTPSPGQEFRGVRAVASLTLTPPVRPWPRPEEAPAPEPLLP